MPSSLQLRLAFADLFSALKRYDLWFLMAWNDIRRRYGRSKIGPFWLTVSTGIFIIGMGPLYGAILNQDIKNYLPYIAVGYVVWTFLSGLVTDACNTFIAEASIFKQVKVPLSLFAFNVIARNVVILVHKVPILLLILLLYPPPSFIPLLWLPISMVLVTLNGVWLALALGMLCARFRDVREIVGSVMQLAFFVTPVLWKSTMVMNAYPWAVSWNPLHHFLDIVRAPLLGAMPTVLSWWVVLIVSILGWLMTLVIFARYRNRIVYWA